MAQHDLDTIHEIHQHAISDDLDGNAVRCREMLTLASRVARRVGYRTLENALLDVRAAHLAGFGLNSQKIRANVEAMRRVEGAA